MIVLHPSSQCDVCYDSYACQDSESNDAPHGISCGHIYCKGCALRSTSSDSLHSRGNPRYLKEIQSPRTCPFCRITVEIEHCIKLHVSPSTRLDTEEGRQEDKVADFMRRLAMASAEEATLREELQTWLSLQPPGSVSVLFRRKPYLNYATS
jgi:hypothetical protein